MKPYLACIIFLLTSLLIGCKKHEDQPSNKSPVSPTANILSTNAHLLDTLTINAVTATTVTIVSTTEYQTGDILIAAPTKKNPLGVFAKVVSVTSNSSAKTYSTVKASLSEAFSQLFINYTYEPSYSGTYKATNSGLKVESLGSNVTIMGSEMGGTTAISFARYKNAGLEITGSLSLNLAQTRIKYVKKNGRSLPDTIIVQAGFNTKGSNLSIEASSVNIPESAILSKELPVIYVPVPIGAIVVPIPFTQTIELNLFPASLSGKAKYKVYPEISASLGVSYEDGSWKNLCTGSIDAKADTLKREDFDEAETGTLVISPTYRVAPLGDKDLSLFFKLPNELSLIIKKDSPNYQLNYALGATLGVKAAFFGKIVDFEQTYTVPLYKTTFLQGDWKYYIGEKIFGGLIFYIDETKKHGLVVDSVDLAKNIGFAYTWRMRPLSPFVTSKDFGTGKQNTLQIINIDRSTLSTIAVLCTNYKGGGFADWYLPSYGELSKLYLQKKISTFSNGVYYSSSSFSNDNFPLFSYGINFTNGVDSMLVGGRNIGYVRAIRNF